MSSFSMGNAIENVELGGVSHLYGTYFTMIYRLILGNFRKQPEMGCWHQTVTRMDSRSCRVSTQ